MRAMATQICQVCGLLRRSRRHGPAEAPQQPAGSSTGGTPFGRDDRAPGWSPHRGGFASGGPVIERVFAFRNLRPLSVQFLGIGQQKGSEVE